VSYGSYIDDVIWQSIVPGLPLNDQAAIYQLWRQLRNDQAQPNPGPPLGPEIETPVGVQQAFSSGIVLGWNAEDGAYIANGR
jgi:hypothetical protein